MATDNTIQEEELKKELAELRQELHMKEVRILARKQSANAKLTVQRKQIDQLEKQIQDLQPTVSRVYSSSNHIRDDQMEGHLIYLLQMIEFYTKEVETKKALIRETEEQIKKQNWELSAQYREYAKKKRAQPGKGQEFVQLRNMSNKMNQIEKRICTLKQENNKKLESIKYLQISLKQHKKEEKEYRREIGRMKEKAQEHLDSAVSSYKEREEFIDRTNMLQDVGSMDLRKAAINENALNQALEKTQKFENFGAVSKKGRSDSRIATTEELIEQGVTGLEPELNKVQDIHSAIVASSGREDPEEMDDQFKLTDDLANSMFSYLKEHLDEIHRTQNTINELKERNRKLLMGMSDRERRMRWEIAEAKKKAKESKSEADVAAEKVVEAKAELDSIMKKVHSLYLKCGVEETKIASEDLKEEARTSEISEMQEVELDEIDDSNALEFVEKIEKKILEGITLIEYDRMKKSVKEDAPQQPIATDEDEPIIEESPEVEYLDTIRPRKLESKPDSTASRKNKKKA